MEIEELVTKFTADVSDYRKEVESIKTELRSVSGLTDSVKEATRKALSSSSSEMQKLGKQLQSLTEKQNKNVQSEVESVKKIADFKEKSKLLVSQLNAQRAEMDKCREALRKLNTQYTEQKNFIADYDDGIEGIRKQRQEMTDYIHNMTEDLNKWKSAEDSVSKTEGIKKYTADIKRLRDDLAAFDDELKAVGLDPKNLKTDSLKSLEKQMQQLAKQEREYKEASVRTNAQIKSTNQSIALEESRYDNLKSTLEQNSVSIEELTNRITKLGKVSVADKIKNKFNGLVTVFKKVTNVVGAPLRVIKNIGSAAAGAFSKVRDGFSKIRSASNTANKALLNTVKSIRRIGIASLGLKICKSVFGELRGIITDYLSQNEALNSRVEALKNAFGNALAPAINVVVGLFEKLMPYAISVANAISKLFSSLGIAKPINATAAAIKNTAGETKKLSEAQSDLYGFDQITKQDDKSSDSDSSGIGSAASAGFAGDIESVGEKLAASCNGIISKLNALDWEGIQKRINNSVSSIAKSINGFVYNFDWYGAGQLLGNGINTVFGAVDTFLSTFDFKALGAGFAKNFNGLFDTVDFGQIGKTLSDGISGLLDLLSGFLETLDWQQIARDVEDFIKGVDWSKMTTSLFEALGAAIGGLSALLGTWISDAVTSAKDYFDEKIKECGGNIGQGILLGLSEAWQNIKTWVNDNIFKPFIDGFKSAFGIASPSKVMKTQGGFIIDGLLAGIGNVWAKVKSKFTDLRTNITNFFSGSDGLQSKIKNLGQNLVTKLGEGLSGLKSKFTTMFRDPLNGVIGLINNMINRINGYLNISINGTLASVLNTLGIGVSGGYYQLFSIPNIPQLASGGVVDRPTIAMVGERGREAVVPLENNTGWMSKLAKMLVEYSNSFGSSDNGDIIIPIQIGDERIMVRSDKRSLLTKDKFKRNKSIT